MFLRDFINDSIASLERLYPAVEARNIVMILCETLLGVKSYTHITEPQTQISPASRASLDSAMARLLAAEPLQYVLGSASFFGRDFRVTPAVLIPRPETELLVSVALSWLRDKAAENMNIAERTNALGNINHEAGDADSGAARSHEGPGICDVPAKINGEDKLARGGAERQLTDPSARIGENCCSNKKALRVLDLCTGSGCIAWSIVLEMPGTEVIAVDISEEALELAASQKFEAALPPVFLKADVLDTEQPFDYGKFDLILSNPPYIMDKEKPTMRPNVLEYEPHLALFVDDADPLIFYRAAARWAQRFLAPGGAAFFEINERLGEQTAASILSAGFRNLQIHRDFAKKNRIISFTNTL